MMEIFFGDNAGWFTVPAFIGTGVFVIRIALLMVAGHGGDLHAGDLHLDSGDVHHGDPGEAFKALSIQSIAAFLMGFGWAALGAYRGTGIHWAGSIVMGVVGGLAMVWLLGLLLKAMYDLQSNGNIDINAAIGHEADVYVTVPPKGEGRGQVRITLQQRQRIINAVTDGQALPTSTRVRITRVNDDNTLTVSLA
jgi:hypothetical protein